MAICEEGQDGRLLKMGKVEGTLMKVVGLLVWVVAEAVSPGLLLSVQTLKLRYLVGSEVMEKMARLYHLGLPSFHWQLEILFKREKKNKVKFLFIFLFLTPYGILIITKHFFASREKNREENFRDQFFGLNSASASEFFLTHIYI